MLTDLLRFVGLTPRTRVTSAQVTSLHTALFVRLLRIDKPTDLVQMREAIGSMSALLGEGCFVIGTQFDLETAQFGAPVNIVGLGRGEAPYPEFSVGQPVVAPQINGFLSGVDKAFRRSFGFPASAFPDLGGVISYVAANFGEPAPGFVSLSVDWPDRPRRMPLREAFELRQEMMRIPGVPELTPDECLGLVISVLKMIFDTSINYDPRVMLRVIYEMTCGMAKRVPVPGSTWLEPGTPIGRVEPIPPIGLMKT